ncbi:MAG: recombinase RecT [Methanoregula sp.]|nr:recombinase RecT [Methanoregula sp.]
MTQVTGKIESYEDTPVGFKVNLSGNQSVPFLRIATPLREKYPVGTGVTVFSQKGLGTTIKALAGSAPEEPGEPTPAAAPTTPEAAPVKEGDNLVKVTGEYRGVVKKLINIKGKDGTIGMYSAAADLLEYLNGPDCEAKIGMRVTLAMENRVAMGIGPAEEAPATAPQQSAATPAGSKPTAKEILEANIKNAAGTAPKKVVPPACKRPACMDPGTYECCPDLKCHIIKEKVRGDCCDQIGAPCNQLPKNECPLEHPAKTPAPAAAPEKSSAPCTSPKSQAPAAAAGTNAPAKQTAPANPAGQPATPKAKETPAAPAELTGIDKIVADTKARNAAAQQQERQQTAVVTVIPPGSLDVNLDPKKIDLIKAICARDCTNSEFELLLYLSKKYELDPLSRQIWAVKYGNEAARIFCGRDGYLQIAHRSNQFDGMESGTKPSDDGKDVVGWCRIYRKDMQHPFYFEAYLSEYTQPIGRSGKPGLWQTKPRVMIQKVAESSCLRRAFSIVGLYSPEEFDDGDA